MIRYLQNNQLCGDLPSVQPASNNVAVSGNLFTCPDPAWCASASCGTCYPQAVGSCALNDDCPGAISLTSGVSVTGINIGANSDDSRISSSCGSISSANGMWFTFNSQTNDLVTLSLCGGSDFDTLLQLFSGTCGTSALVCMNNDDNGCGGVESLLSNIVIQTNTQYFVLVSGSSSSESGQFSLTMSLSSTSGGGGDPHIKDSCGNLFDIPSDFAGKIMQLYHDDQLHINAFIDHQSKFFTQIGVKLRVNSNNDYFETLECRLDNGYPNFYLNGVSFIDHSNVLPDWIKVYEPRHRLGAGVLSELGRYQLIELELDSMLIIVGGHHPVLKGFFNVQVNRQPVDHSSLFHCPQEGNHERSSLDLFKFIRDSIFEQ